MDVEARSGYRSGQNGFGEYCASCLRFRERVNEFTPGRKFDTTTAMHHHAMIHVSLAEVNQKVDVSLRSCFPNTFTNTANHRSCPQKSFNNLQIPANPCGEFQTQIPANSCGESQTDKVTSSHSITKDFGNKQSSVVESADVNDRYSTNSAYRLNAPSSFVNFHTRTANSSDEYQTGPARPAAFSTPFTANSLKNMLSVSSSGLHSAGANHTTSSVWDTSNLRLNDYSAVNAISKSESINNDGNSSVLSGATESKPSSNPNPSDENCSQPDGRAKKFRCGRPKKNQPNLSTEKVSKSNLLSKLDDFVLKHPISRSELINNDYTRRSSVLFGGTIRRRGNRGAGVRIPQAVSSVSVKNNSTLNSKVNSTSNVAVPGTGTAVSRVGGQLNLKRSIETLALDNDVDDSEQSKTRKIESTKKRRSTKILVLDPVVSTKLIGKFKNGDQIKCRSCGWFYYQKAKGPIVTTNCLRSICVHIFKAHVHGEKGRYKCLTCNLYFNFNVLRNHPNHSVLDLAALYKNEINEFVESNFVDSSLKKHGTPSPDIVLPNIEEKYSNALLNGNGTGEALPNTETSEIKTEINFVFDDQN